MSGRKKKGEASDPKPKKSGGGRKKAAATKSAELDTNSNPFIFDSSSFQSASWQQWTPVEGFQFKFFQRDLSQESTVFDADPESNDALSVSTPRNLSTSSTSQTSAGRSSQHMTPRSSSNIPVINLATSPVLAPILNSSFANTPTLNIPQIGITPPSTSSPMPLPSFSNGGGSLLPQIPIITGGLPPTPNFSPLSTPISSSGSPPDSPILSPSSGSVGLSVGSLYKTPTSEFLSVNPTIPNTLFSTKSLERIGQQLSRPEDSKQLLNWTLVTVPSSEEGLQLDLSISNLDNSHRIENNIPVLNYNTKNDYLTFKMAAKVSGVNLASTPSFQGKVALVKRKANSKSSATSLDNFAELHRTRKPTLPALTVSHKEDGFFSFDHTLSANLEINVWDVTKNHYFSKNKQKRCTKSQCPCDGSTEEAFILITVFRDNSPDPVFCKLSNGFHIKSSNKRKGSESESSASAQSKAAKTKSTSSPSTATQLANSPRGSWQWTPLASQVLPRPFAYHTITKLDHCAVLFGGRSEVGGLFSKYKPPQTSPLSNDVWVLKNDKWIFCKVEGLKPEPRFAHSAVCVFNSVLIFGGELESGAANDLWLLRVSQDGESGIWKRIDLDPLAPKPAARSGHSAVVTTIKGKTVMIVHGGTRDKESLEETWLLYLAEGKGTWSQVQSKGPASRFYHSACMVTLNQRKKMVIFGGSYRTLVNNERVMRWLNDLWILDTEELFWQQLIPVGELAPKARDGHNAFLIGDKMYITGGWIGQTKLNQGLQSMENKSSTDLMSLGMNMLSELPEATFSSDLWEFDFQKSVWGHIELQPKPPSFGHSSGIVADNSLLLFGGETFPPAVMSTAWKLFKL